MYKSNHENCIKYIDTLKNVIETADYVGQGSKNGKHSFELIKIFDKNILVAIKFDKKGEYLYVASIYEVAQSKLNNRINSGRIKRLK